jgi:hypothetical protein
MSATTAIINTESVAAYSEGAERPIRLSTRGEVCILDFYTAMIMEGRGYEVRAGTISVPLVGDIVITDTKAEMCVDAPSGTTAIPIYLNIAVNLGTGTLHEYALKSIASASTSGTAFVPLPMKLGGAASACTARVGAAGGVVVGAELNTTTRCLWAGANELAVAAGHEVTTHIYKPKVPHVITGVGCVYAQIAATTTGPSYYATLEFIELDSDSIA